MLNIETENQVTTICISRPKVKNAFNAELISELTEAFQKVSVDDESRLIVLTGEGDIFSAGADIDYMRDIGQMGKMENKADAIKLSKLFQTVSSCPKPVIGKINGSAFGGGVGLVSVCDVSIALESSKFSFSEVRLGIAPATISPFVLRKIGYANARVYFLSGAVFDSHEARRIGLIHEVVSDESELDDKTAKWVKDFMKAAPGAQSETKRLIDNVAVDGFSDEIYDKTADLIAELRGRDEAKEGLSAFLEKRKPEWIEKK